MGGGISNRTLAKSSMRELLSFLSRLPQRLQVALAAARHPHKGLLSISLPLELPPGAEALPPNFPQWFYWNEPAQDCCRLGLGGIVLSQATGPRRLETLADALARDAAVWERPASEAGAAGPLLFAAFAFDPKDPMQGSWQGFPNALLTLPELLLRRDGNVWSLTFSCRQRDPTEAILARWLELASLIPACLQPASAPPRDQRWRQQEKPPRGEWLRLAADAAAACAGPSLDKIVLARRLRLEATTGFPARPLLAGLIREFPGCHLFAAALHGRVLVSASPERLLSCRAGELLCDAVGGTLSRADELLLAQHAKTSKLMREHRLVVEAIAQALTPVCGPLSYPEQPRLLRLRDLLHLWTEVRARVKPGQNLLSLAARLHPTPAVNGAPRAAALDWLRRREPFRRGWYAGGGGWLDPAGDGDLAVLLRSALLDIRGAELYAGAGILCDSDPQAEYAETELKLRTIQRALRGAGTASAPRRAAVE